MDSAASDAAAIDGADLRPASISPRSRTAQTGRGIEAALPALVCRRIRDDDIEAVVSLLLAGFPERSLAYWQRALERLRVRAVPDGLPRYGYVIADDERLVGVLLLIASITETADMRCNVSSWYVEAAYRGFSHILLSAPLRLKNTTLFNISPAASTVETIEAQGFTRYVNGTYIAFAGVARPVFGVRIRRVEAGELDADPLTRDHAAWGCLCFEVEHEGSTHSFVFVRRRIMHALVPCAQLVFCRHVDDFARFAGPLGRRLLRLGIGAVLIDANEPIAGLTGLYRPGRSPKFSRGSVTPRLGDLSYTELVIFGS